MKPGQFRVRAYIYSISKPTEHWVVCDSDNGSETQYYMTTEGELLYKPLNHDNVKFNTRGDAESALWAAKIRGDMQ